MTYSVTEHYGEKVRESVLKEYDTDSLERDIKYAEEDLKDIKEYLRITNDQLIKARGTRSKHYVEFRKEHNYATKHINYIILVFQLPDIPDADKNARRMYLYMPSSEPGGHNKPFLGNEKRQAIEKARSLSEKYNAQIVGNAAELVKKKEVVVL